MKINFKILMLLLAIIFSMNSIACRNEYLDKSSSESYTVIKEQSITLKDLRNIVVKTDVGDIILTSWDKNEVYIKISGNKKAHSKMSFNIIENKDFVEITGDKNTSFFNFSSIGVKIEIKVPKNFDSKLLTKGGDVHISELNGNQYIRTSGGDIKAKRVSGKIDGTTSGGDIIFDQIKGNTKVITSGGDIKINGFEGDFSTSTSGGDIELIGKNGKIDASTSGGNILLDYSGENKGIELNTSGGNIEINLPADFNAKADLHTSGGEISVKLNTSNLEKISTSKFQADLNKGGALLHAQTSGGDIKINKK